MSYTMNYEESKMESELETVNEWGQTEDNLFSTNHRNLMIQHHGGTMAQHYSVEDFIKEYNLRVMLKN